MSPADHEIDAPAVARGFELKRLPADFFDDPYRYYGALRDHDPVHRMGDGAYFLTRWRDCDAVYRDAKTFSSDKKVEFRPKYGDAPLFAHHTTSLVFNDPPLHTHVRRAIQTALSNRVIAGMEQGLVALVDRLLDGIAARRRVDLIDEYAGAIPVEIIGNLLGVPHAEREPLRGWSLAILGALEPVLTPERAEAGNRAVVEMSAYLKTLIDERRTSPRDADTDVLTRLIHGDGGDEPLTESELTHQCIFLLNAGHETTTNLIGNALHALTQWPAERARLVADPSLIHSAVEEFLRFESSNQLGNRISTAPCAVGGVELSAQARVTMCIGAANRDPAQFPDPDRLDLARTPNRHIAFGFGIHTCAGLNLARLEGRVAISRFLARFPDYALDGAPVRGGRARFRGFLHLPARI